jgi:FlaA1/EpsC-like NDP-sugar epimerase
MTIRRIANLSLVLLQRRTFFIAVFQSILVFASFGFAWFLRFDLSLPYRSVFLYSALILVTIRLATFIKFDLLHGWWQYTGVSDAANIVRVIAVGTVVFWLTMQILPIGLGFPRSLFLLEPILSGVALGGVRLISRAVAESARRDSQWEEKTLLVGAGFAAQMVIRELSHSPGKCRIIGCVDDDESKTGVSFSGVRVLGTIAQLRSILTIHPADELIIAIPSASNQQMRRIVAVCNETGLKFRTVPSLRDLVSGNLKVTQIRDVSLDDLLGREPAKIDLESVAAVIAGKRALVTGAAGSIGAELCRQILEYSPGQLACVDQSENGLFFLGRDLSTHQNGSLISLRVADVADHDRLINICSEFRPEIIFHAAAYKHVPMMEANVHEAVKNNVFGFVNILQIAEEVGCGAFVLISSDKAVNPTNVMGATKRICELVLSSKPPNGMRCVSVRFGNVLGSSGSVVRVLREQLETNAALTITHPEIKRFFMTTREAVALVLQASAIGNHADVLVLDMGEPMKILDLARNLIRLSGKSEDDVHIEYTGLRPGEKFEEELFYDSETTLPTSCPKIRRTQADSRNWSVLGSKLDRLFECLPDVDTLAVRRMIAEIVTEYSFEGAQTNDRASTASDVRHTHKTVGAP